VKPIENRSTFLCVLCNAGCVNVYRCKRDELCDAKMSMDWIGLGPMTVMYKILTA